MGGGTTGVVALQINRKFIGIDKSEEAFRIARRRLRLISVETAHVATI
jgi:DNA modification methylase